MEKNETQISGFAVMKKAPSPWKKNFFWKKILPTYLCRYDLQNGVWKYFPHNGSRDISVSVILRFWKMGLQNKIINKTWSTKNQENSKHNYLTNHLSESLSTSFNFSCDLC